VLENIIGLINKRSVRVFGSANDALILTNYTTDARYYALPSFRAAVETMTIPSNDISRSFWIIYKVEKQSIMSVILY